MNLLPKSQPSCQVAMLADVPDTALNPKQSMSHVLVLVCLLALAATCAVMANSSGATGFRPWMPLNRVSQLTTQPQLYSFKRQPQHALPEERQQTTPSQPWHHREQQDHDSVMQYFPQAETCGSHPRFGNYSQLHQGIMSGKLPQRYLVSIPVKSGLADRLTGLVTQFYMALLSQRALTTVDYGKLPSVNAICDTANFHWSHPHQIPLQLQKTMVRPRRSGRQLPDSVDASLYYGMFHFNDGRAVADFMQSEDFDSFPEGNPEVQNVVVASNRGGAYAMMGNRYHENELSSYGLTPENAFMCGFFYMCRPNNGVLDLYEQFWQAMSEPNTLKIGIQVRLGDSVFQHDLEGDSESVLAKAEHHFKCAIAVEEAYALPGQKVIWYLMSDSLALSQAAQQKYGSKLLTQLAYKPTHVDCPRHNPEACSEDNINLALQHALGQILTFSKADYHVFSMHSGFGRIGAWLSGRVGNMYEIDADECDPQNPTLPSESASHWSGI